MIIKKKTWPDIFQRVFDGKKNAEIRLADFDIKEGDTLILEEYNPKTKSYTGRSIEKKVKLVNKVPVAEFHTQEEFKKHGVWLIEME